MSQNDNNVPPPPFSDYYGGRGRHRRFDERDYEEIYYHFDDYSQDIILANASKFMTPPEPAEHYEWEEVILDEVSQSEWEGMKKSLYFGMGCGLLGFGMLRWRRARGGLFSRMSRYASSSSSSSSSRPTGAGGYTFDALPPKPNHGFHQQHHYTGGGGYSNPRAGYFVDATLSTLLGLGASLLAIESDAFYPNINNGTDVDAIEPPPQWISPSIPLVPGRSIIADTLCGPLTEEFRKFPMDLWRSGNDRGVENGYVNHMALYANSGWKGTKYYEGNGNASVVDLGEDGDEERGDGASRRGVYERLVLDSLQGFVVNCERRSRHERRIREIKGMREGTPVVIPESGVTAEEDMDLSDIYYSSDGDQDDVDAGFGL